MNEFERQGEHDSLRIIGGLLLIAIGVVLLIANFFFLPTLGALWPLIILGIGAAFFVVMVARGPAAGGLAVPGSILSLLGIVLFMQNLNGAWFNMTFMWPLFVFGGIGFGLLINSWWSDKMELKRAGYAMLGMAIAFFIAFGAFFGMLFEANNAVVVVAVLLIGAGVLSLVLRVSNTANLVDRLPPHHGHHAMPG